MHPQNKEYIVYTKVYVSYSGRSSKDLCNSDLWVTDSEIIRKL